MYSYRRVSRFSVSVDDRKAAEDETVPEVDIACRSMFADVSLHEISDRVVKQEEVSEIKIAAEM